MFLETKSRPKFLDLYASIYDNSLLYILHFSKGNQAESTAFDYDFCIYR